MERNEIIEKLRLQLITQKTTLSEIQAEVRAFLEGGGRWVQLRMKDTPAETIVETGKQVLPLCREYGAVFIVNDQPNIALQIGADGVHIGKNDISPTEARKILGADKIIGCTANTFEDIEQLNGYPIDYIGLGPFRFTTTKKNLSPVLGAEGYRRIFSQMQEHGITMPVTVIGGITLEDIPVFKAIEKACFAREGGAGGRALLSHYINYAVSGSISNAEDPTEMTQEFLTEILKETI